MRFTQIRARKQMEEAEENVESLEAFRPAD